MPYGFGYKRYYRRIAPPRVGGGFVVYSTPKYRTAYRRSTVRTKKRSYRYTNTRRRGFAVYKRGIVGGRYRVGLRSRR